MRINNIYHLLVVVFLSGSILTLDVKAQSKSGWHHVARIPVDSLLPCRLIALDSLHCIFTGYTYSNYYTRFGLPATATKLHWFLTSDGGESWNKLNFDIPDFPDTSAASVFRFFAPSFMQNICLSPGGSTIYLTSWTSVPSDSSGYFSLARRPRRVLHSSDYGNSWRVIFNLDSSDIFTRQLPPSLQSVPERNLMFVTTPDGKIHYSGNYGASFTTLPRDSIFLNAVMPRLASYGDTETISGLQLVHSDLTSLTVQLGGSHWNIPSPDSGTHYNNGLTTLVSTNGGGSWTKHTYRLPGYESLKLTGEFQYCKGTPSLYYLLYNSYTPGVYGKENSVEGNLNFAWDITKPGDASARIYDISGDSYYNTSYLYSPDYGKTWTQQIAYGKRRRGFEATQPGDVWMTVSPEDSIYFLDSKASTIVHTTDNGLTWSEDPWSLQYLEQPLDGKIISFSDPKHGWIAATDGIFSTHIFRYTVKETQSVELRWEDDPNNIRQKAKIYPLPADESVKIVIPYQRRVTDVQFYDVMGRAISTPLTIDGSSVTIETKHLSTGCYVTRIMTQDGSSYLERIAVVR